jgi:hypothetical protein
MPGGEETVEEAEEIGLEEDGMFGGGEMLEEGEEVGQM